MSSTLSSSDLSVAVAQKLGWKHEPGEEPRYGGPYKVARWIRPDGKIWEYSNWKQKDASGLPPYSTSLDACSEFEATLTEDERAAYVQALHEAAKAELWGSFEAICASPRHRCAAFLAVRQP